jgi:hypothetical protein
MFTLRVLRHDRHEQVLAECLSTVVPARGEVLQLDTLDEHGEPSRPSTMWRVVSVTLHVPSKSSSAPAKGGDALSVRRVEVTVLPDVSLVHEFAHAAEEILSESKM